MKFLENENEIQTIILSGYWPNTRIEAHQIAALEIKNENIFTQSINNTLDWLIKNKKQVLLLGPIPTYQKNIPFSLAINNKVNNQTPRKTSKEILDEYQIFFNAAHSLNQNPKIKLLIPADWFCKPDCIISINNISLYRDSNHLSIEGSMAFTTQIEDGLNSLTSNQIPH